MTRAQVQSDTETNDGADTQAGRPEGPRSAIILGSAEQKEKIGLHRSSIISRPSSVTGRAYEQVSAAYVAAVHSVLTGKETAPTAAAALEKQLIRITGFRVAFARPEK